MRGLKLLPPLRKSLDAVHAAVKEAVKTAGDICYGKLVGEEALDGSLRPSLVFICGRLCGRPVVSVLPLAKAVQFIFVAGEVHRRAVAGELGGSSLKSHILLGDYLYSGAFRVLADAGLQEMLIPLSKVVQAECEAAVTSVNDAKPDPETIKKETALLVGESCRLPGLLAAVDFVDQLYNFGINLGMACGYLKRKRPLVEISGYLKSCEEALSQLPAGSVCQQLERIVRFVAENGLSAEAAATR
ncbi:MAG: hypothetical protein AB1426_03745 [Bacillota bacterium]